MWIRNAHFSSWNLSQLFCQTNDFFQDTPRRILDFFSFKRYKILLPVDDNRISICGLKWSLRNLSLKERVRPPTFYWHPSYSSSCLQRLSFMSCLYICYFCAHDEHGHPILFHYEQLSHTVYTLPALS